MPGKIGDKIEDVLHNPMKERLARDEVVSSMTVRLTRGIEIAQIAKTAGFDSLYVDMEHSALSLETTGQICMAALAVGVTPLVRVPGIAEVSRVLDAGALGIIAPHIRSAEDARAYVVAAKFPPLGERSAAGPMPHLRYRSFPAAQADAALNAATLLMVQFESEDAVANADAIAAVEGVDMVMIGSNDLLADLGLPGQYEHPRLHEAYAATITACRRHGKHVGVGGLASRPDLAANFVKMGARYVSTGTDLGFLLAAATAKAKEVRDIAVS
ncbi:MAG TPA: aldolase/citrate lyase family protein [Xanthobacteraceae bacterium]|jgi:2-keto-3-deoxy-L-rhamnonate aldolase RhmA|nr:aldolase/citrate lyase family protein [Xanthobacteraceae bacterium]